MTAYALAFQPLLPQPYWNNSQIAAPTAAHEFSKTKRALIAAQNVLETGARSSFHKPLPFNEDRVFQQHRAILPATD